MGLLISVSCIPSGFDASLKQALTALTPPPGVVPITGSNTPSQEGSASSTSASGTAAASASGSKAGADNAAAKLALRTQILDKLGAAYMAVKVSNNDRFLHV